MLVPGPRLPSTLGCGDGVTTSTSRDEPHDRANDTRLSRLSDRMPVFRDDPDSYGGDARDEQICSFTFPARQPRSESIHSEPQSALDERGMEGNVGRQGIIIPLREEGDVAASTSANQRQLIEQLQKIATMRSALLEQLAGLHIEEVDILAQLAQARHLPPPPNISLPSPLPRPLNAPIPAIRQRSPSKVPRLQPLQPHRPTSHKRALSAPTVPKPAGESGRNAVVEASKRVPLSEKKVEPPTYQDVTIHSRSRSEVVGPHREAEQGTKQVVGHALPSSVYAEQVQQPTPHHEDEELDQVAIVSDIPQEMRFPVRSRALSQSSVKSHGSVKSQSNIKKGSRSKSREDAKSEDTVKASHGRSKSQTSNKSEERKKSQSRSKSGNRERGRPPPAAIVTTAVQLPPTDEQAKPPKVVTPRAYLGKKWEF